jgi:hypothetical protein
VLSSAMTPTTGGVSETEEDRHLIFENAACAGVSFALAASSAFLPLSPASSSPGRGVWAVSARHVGWQRRPLVDEADVPCRPRSLKLRLSSHGVQALQLSIPPRSSSQACIWARNVAHARPKT